MPRSLKGRHFLSMADLSPAELADLLKSAHALKKAGRRAPRGGLPLEGRVLGMIFQKPSTRTRVSFEVAMLQLGGHAIFLGAGDIQLKRGETVADTARVLSRYCDGIMARVFAHSDLEELAANSRVPVINGLSDLTHPCQTLADLMTLEEQGKVLKKTKLAYVGDGNNVCHSLMLGMALAGGRCAVATPPGYGPKPEIVSKAGVIARRTGGSVEVTRDPKTAAKGADALYTDVWASMGQEAEHDARAKIFRPYRLDAGLLRVAAKDAVVLHCLPAHRGEEIAAGVLDGPQSVVWDQAENRLHAQKALLAALLA